MFVGHKLPGATVTNPFGALLRELRANVGVDIVCAGHVHTWNYATMYAYGKYVHMATNGTYCVGEEYAKRHYNEIGDLVNHYFLFNGSEILHFDSLVDAVVFRKTWTQ